ncbi:UBX domain-containing protein 2B [Bombina bombina]|uniref:UBX domain-containing protein 2B n=1 Tax=Bombina bombina TaxID=8345 RepID=UPI00235A4AE4|nr:UBX domain-containing protein 2B [Bombina bombina]
MEKEEMESGEEEKGELEDEDNEEMDQSGEKEKGGILETHTWEKEQSEEEKRELSEEAEGDRDKPVQQESEERGRSVLFEESEDEEKEKEQPESEDSEDTRQPGDEENERGQGDQEERRQSEQDESVQSGQEREGSQVWEAGEEQTENGEETGEKVKRQHALRPSALDIQLALARLCEDEFSDDPSEFDAPRLMLESNQNSPLERLHVGDVRLDSTGRIVHELFKEAKEHGAVPVEEASKVTKDLYKSFAGGGYKLGDSFQKQSEYIYGDENSQEVQILLKLWRNGFSLDDGELRSYRDPINAQFLESIKRGEIPVELQRLVHGGQVNLDMEDHQDQEYVKPRLKFKAFSGEGQKLGSVTPEIISTPSSPEEEHKAFPNLVVELDECEPTTKIQIRLCDGSRLIQRFNLTHRIADVRQFIIQSRSEFAQTDFVLVTTFPNLEITDESQTLEEANIVNTVILQRLK